MAYDVKQMENYIRQAAAARGIDPNIAVRVARSEGLANGVWQSRLSKGGRTEPSYGPFQLLKGGKGTGYPTGMGNDFMRVTGMDPADPKNAYATVDFALDQAAQKGWSPWYGAAKVGVGRRDGLGSARAVGRYGRSLNSVPASASPSGGPTPTAAWRPSSLHGPAFSVNPGGPAPSLYDRGTVPDAPIGDPMGGAASPMVAQVDGSPMAGNAVGDTGFFPAAPDQATSWADKLKSITDAKVPGGGAGSALGAIAKAFSGSGKKKENNFLPTSHAAFSSSMSQRMGQAQGLMSQLLKNKGIV